MRTAAHLLTLSFGAGVICGSALAQGEITNLKTIASAKSVYLQNKSGVDAVGQKALNELKKWGRYQIAPDSQKADLIVVISTDPPGGNLILSGGQTGTIDAQGHIEEDRVPNFNKLEPVRYGSLTVTDARSGESLWVCAKRWGGLLTGFNSVGERLVKEFERKVESIDAWSQLKLIKLSTRGEQEKDRRRSRRKGFGG